MVECIITAIVLYILGGLGIYWAADSYGDLRFLLVWPILVVITLIYIIGEALFSE